MKVYKIKLNNKVYEVEVEVSSNNGSIQMPATQATPVASAQVASAPASPDPAVAPANIEGGQKVEVPMPGTILDIRVQVGQKINKGDVIAILEAMKMENEIVAPVSGQILAVGVAKGDSVNVGNLIVSIG